MSAQTQVGQQLLLVDRSDCLDGLQFNDHQVLDNQIGFERLFNVNCFIVDRNGMLIHHLKTTLPQFIKENSLINRLKQSRPESRVDLERSINDLPRNLVLRQLPLRILCVFASSLCVFA